MEMPIFLWFEKKWICFSGFVVFNVLIMNIDYLNCVVNIIDLIYILSGYIFVSKK